MMSDSSKKSIRERFLAMDTANVADVLDELGMYDQGLAPMTGRTCLGASGSSAERSV